MSEPGIEPLTNCVLCGESMSGEVSRNLGDPMHRVCSLRGVIGGIGHLLDHDHFCVELHDPDAGLSYRISALLVDELVAEMGAEWAASRG